MSTFADDRTSGSSDVALAFLAELERWAAIDVSTTAPAFRIALLTFLRGAQAAQPSMALVHQLAARALEVTDAGGRRGETPPALRDEIARTCEAERGDLARVRMALARQACGLLDRREPWIATVSSSGAVREALLEAQRRNLAPRALVAEGRPLLEGREMARVLAQAGLPVWLMADAALPMLIGQATQVWIGADAITDQGVLNKVGSFALAPRRARTLGAGLRDCRAAQADPGDDARAAHRRDAAGGDLGRAGRGSAAAQRVLRGRADGLVARHRGRRRGAAAGRGRAHRARAAAA
jgi:translation initiation factor eIF-2B subunit delta